MHKVKIIAAVLVAALVAPALALAQMSPDKQAAKDAIWTMEQAIYAGRATGNMSNYVNNTSPDYVAWPPTVDAPMGYAKLKANSSTVPGSSKEKLTMEFMDIAVHGDVAVIYYKTHRTQLFDGSPANDHFQTTHTWIRTNGHWQVLGGMARLETKH